MAGESITAVGAVAAGVVGTPVDPPPEPRLPPPPAASHADCGNYHLVSSDTQYTEKRTWTLIPSSTVGNNGPPAFRLPPSELAVSKVQAALARAYSEGIPSACRNYNEGTLFNGDIADSGIVPELEYFFNAQQSIEAHDPNNRIVSVSPGNHDAFPNGTFNTGEAFFGLLSIFFNVGFWTRRSFIDNVAGYAAGGKAQLLDKEKLFRRVYQYFGYDWSPVEMAEADLESFRLKKSEPQDWNKSPPLWRSDPDRKSWHLLVNYKPDDKDRKPENRWLGLSAKELGRYETTGGETPVYLINLDTIDFLEDSSVDGAIDGHISYIQTRLVQAFIRKKQAENPKAKFILASHYKLTNIDKQWFAKRNHFGEVLSNPSVIASLVAHTHRWNYENINVAGTAEELGISGRSTPLPVINTPSLIDQPIGAGRLHLHAEGDNVVIDFDKVAIDRDRLLAEASPEVRAELAAVDPHILAYVPAWENIQHKFLKFIAHVRGGMFAKAGALLNWDYGALAEPGKINDLVIARDTIPAMVEVANLRMQLYMGAMRLALHDLGVHDSEDQLNAAFKNYLATVYGYYRSAVTSYTGTKSPDQYFTDPEERFTEARVNQMRPARSTSTEETRGIDRYTEAVGFAFAAVLTEVKTMRQQTDLTDEQKTTLASVERLTRDMYDITTLYKNWVINYGDALAVRRPDSELNVFSNLMTPGYWADAEQAIRALPYSSSATSFQLLASLRAAEVRDQFRLKVEPRQTPDHIRIAVNSSTNHIEMSQPLAPLADAEVARRLATLPQFPGSDQASLDTARADLNLPATMTHWAARAGLRRGGGVGALSFHAGGQGHLFWDPWLNHRPGLFQLTGVVTGDVYTDGHRGTELGLTAAALFDVSGYLAVGPAVRGGVSIGNRNRGGASSSNVWGVGGQGQIFDGILFGGLTRDQYNDGFHQWTLSAGADLEAGLRAVNLLPRDF